MVINPTFNNILIISYWSVLLVEESGVPRENHRPVADKLYHIMLLSMEIVLILKSNEWEESHLLLLNKHE